VRSRGSVMIVVAALVGISQLSGAVAAHADVAGITAIALPGSGGLTATAAGKVFIAPRYASGIDVFSASGAQLPTIADAGNVS
jgi:hypothetical protein